VVTLSNIEKLKKFPGDKMLTTTYAVLTLSVEQKKTSAVFSALYQYFQTGSESMQDFDPDSLQPVLNHLAQFDASCHRRKVEMYVIPAIQKTTRDADSLLAELASLSLIGTTILRAVRERFLLAFEQGFIEIRALCSAMRLYCYSQLQRLEKEETELFPLAQRVITSEEWFSIGTNFLALAAKNHGSKRPAHAPWHPMERISVCAI
jgi:hemerythrin-like domain-containing protein